MGFIVNLNDNPNDNPNDNVNDDEDENEDDDDNLNDNGNDDVNENDGDDEDEYMTMQLIEPCCAPKHLLALRGKLGDGGTAFWHGYGDLSVAELLPPMLTRYSEVEMMIVAPRLPDAAARVIRRMLQKQWMTADGKGKIDVIKHLMLVTDLSEQRSPMAYGWTKEHPFGERLTLKNVQQNDTAILLPDIAFVGNINLSYGGHFTAIATKSAKTIAGLRSLYEAL